MAYSWFSTIAESTSTSVTKNTDTIADAASSSNVTKAGSSLLKSYEAVPATSSTLTKVGTYMSKNPKIAIAGVSTLAAAGYITVQMSSGLSFDEAWDKLVDIVENATAKVVSSATSAATGIVSSGTEALLESLLGENWMNYVYGFFGLVGLIFILKLYKLIKSL